MTRWPDIVTPKVQAQFDALAAKYRRQSEERLADAAARKARGEPPKVVRLAYDPHAGPNLAVGAPRFPGAA